MASAGERGPPQLLEKTQPPKTTSDTRETVPREITRRDHQRAAPGVHHRRNHAPGRPSPPTHALVDRLNAGEPYAVAFGGQGAAWLENLEELVSSAGIESELSQIVAEAELLLEPVARELVVVRPIGFEPMKWVRALAAEEPLPPTRQLTTAAISAPGILLAQIAAIRALVRQGLDLYGAPPVATAGHSQGKFACRRAARQGRPRRRDAGDPATRGRRRLADVASPGHGRPRRQDADGVGDQRRPRPHGRTARGVLHGRPHGAAAGAVDPQRQALRRHHRNAGATRSVRALLQQDHRTRRGRTQEQDPRRRGLLPGLPRHPGRGRLPYPTAGPCRRSHRQLGGAHRARPRAHPRIRRVGVRPARRLGRGGRAAARLRREVDHRPRPERHRHQADGADRPRSGCRSRPRGHPGGSAQPVHRRRRARGAACRGRAMRRRPSSCPTAR